MRLLLTFIKDFFPIDSGTVINQKLSCIILFNDYKLIFSKSKFCLQNRTLNDNFKIHALLHKV